MVNSGSEGFERLDNKDYQPELDYETDGPMHDSFWFILTADSDQKILGLFSRSQSINSDAIVYSVAISVFDPNYDYYFLTYLNRLLAFCVEHTIKIDVITTSGNKKTEQFAKTILHAVYIGN